MPRRPSLFPHLALAGLLAAFAAGDAAAIGPADAPEKRSPATAEEGLNVAADLDVTLFAAEPMLLSPANIDVDHAGRVWVCEIVNYRRFRNPQNPERTEGDRILVLEDTDGDGVADAKTTFYQGPEIDSPHGVCVLGETVIVSAGDSVWLFTDADGDLVADPGSKRKLFTGIGGVQHDHGIHSFLFGPDGKLYFNFGNEGQQLLRPDGSPVVDLAGNEVKAGVQPYQQGMVFRCDLDGSNVETLGWNFRNNWELTVDSFGTIWQSDNDDDGNRGTRLNYVMPFGNYGYRDEFTGAGWREPRVGWEEEVPERHWHLNDPGVVPNLYQSGAGSPTGIAVYEGDLLPERYRGELLHCDAGPNAVRLYDVEPDGAGYTATQHDVLTGERDRWFRPSDVAVAPDGSLIVADWYDPGVGGHLMGDTKRGRIFRLTPKGAGKKYVVPTLDTSTEDGAIAALRSPNNEARYLGFSALVNRGGTTEQVLSEVYRSDDDPRMRARALWVLSKWDGIGWGLAADALDDRDPNLRITALRAFRQSLPAKGIEMRKGQDGPVAVRLPADDLLASAIGALADDGDPAVRREAALSLRGNLSSEAPAVWATLAEQYDGADRWYLEALGIAAAGQWDRFLPQYLARLGPDWAEEPAARDVVWRSRAANTPELLARMIRDPQVPADEVPRMLRALELQPGDAATAQRAELAFADDLPADRAELVRLESLAGLSGSDDPRFGPAVSRTLDDARGTDRFVSLVDKFRVTDRDAELVELAVERPDESAGVAAAASLLNRKQWDVLGKTLYGDDRDRALALTAALGRTGSGDAVGMLMPFVEQADWDGTRRRAAVAALGRSWTGREKLLVLAEKRQLPEELSPAVAAALHGVAWAGFEDRIEAVFPSPPGRDAAPLPPVNELAARRGDPLAGKLIYATTGTCIKCHVVDGVGKEVGPNLSEIGDKLGRDALYNSILYPSAGISHNYEMYTLVTDGGTVESGLKISESDSEVTLRTLEGIDRRFPTDEVLEMSRQDVSLMPADLQKLMTTRELVDVVEYLSTLKKTR